MLEPITPVPIQPSFVSPGVILMTAIRRFPFREVFMNADALCGEHDESNREEYSPASAQCHVGKKRCRGQRGNEP